MRLLGFRKKRTNKKNDHQVQEPFCADPCGDYLLRTGGYCKLLKEKEQWQFDAIESAKNLLRNYMAFVPAGSTKLQSVASTEEEEIASAVVVEEPGFFIDRWAVTNAQFKRFVDADAYRDASFWPVEIQPYMFQFVDQTGSPGPSTWINGCYASEKRDHPVVGISWHEANAYANWLGKLLPSSAQWQRSASWWNSNLRYPWGGSFSEQHANVYASGFGNTVPVASYAESATPNGVFQLVGNVWEWVNTSISGVELHGQMQQLNEMLGEIRGGAFDTYFPSQATSSFRSGQSLLNRCHNVGFRCIVDAQLLIQ